jgi:hypothetical protein
MFGRTCICVCAAAVALCVSNPAPRVQAAGLVDDVLLLKSPAYPEHSKQPVPFKHRMHAEVLGRKYPRIFKNGCGECHHDENGEPLAGIAYGDEVEACIVCHPKPGEMPPAEKRRLRDRGLSHSEINVEELAYHAEAMHAKCRGCHRRARKEADTRTPPITCSKCHSGKP